MNLILTFSKVGLCCIQLPILLTTYYSSHQGLSFVVIEGIPFILPPLNLDRHWSGSSLLYKPPNTRLKTYTRFLDLLKIYVTRMKRPRYSNIKVTNEKSEYLHNVKVMITQMLVPTTWYQDEVCKSHAKIIGLALYWDHMIGKSRDHNITIDFFLRRKFYWACNCLLRINLE